MTTFNRWSVEWANQSGRTTHAFFKVRGDAVRFMAYLHRSTIYGKPARVTLERIALPRPLAERDNPPAEAGTTEESK